MLSERFLQLDGNQGSVRIHLQIIMESSNSFL
jgi:hypothetical protein